MPVGGYLRVVLSGGQCEQEKLLHPLYQMGRVEVFVEPVGVGGIGKADADGGIAAAEWDIGVGTAGEVLDIAVADVGESGIGRLDEHGVAWNFAGRTMTDLRHRDVGIAKGAPGLLDDSFDRAHDMLQRCIVN